MLFRGYLKFVLLKLILFFLSSVQINRIIQEKCYIYMKYEYHMKTKLARFPSFKEAQFALVNLLC